MRAAAAVTSAIILMLTAAVSARAAEQYTVARHDTLYSVARRYGVSVAALARANGLRDPSRIRAGTVLLIPDTSAPAFRGPAGVPGSSPRGRASLLRSIPAAPAPARGHTAAIYVVRPGDTLYSLARIHGLTVAALQEANHLASADRLRAGQALQIPAAGVRGTADMSAPATVIQRPGFEGPNRASMDMPSLRPGPERMAELGRRVTTAAMRYVGTPYVWGGTSPAGVDCSGLVYLVYAPYVPHLPRLSHDQWTAGVAVDRNDLSPGDLVFFNTDGSGASHVGIYIGNEQFVHPAFQQRRVVIDRLDAPYYASHYLGARRVL